MKLKNKFDQMLSKLKELQPIDSSIVSTLYALSQKSLITAILFTILITIFLYSELSYKVVLWATLLILFLLFRLYYASLFKRNCEKYSVELWHKKFMIFAFITGVMISSLGFLFIPLLDQYHQLFVLASLLGLTGGATTSLASDFRIAIIYISIIMLPLIVSLFMINSSISFILAILMILFFLSQIGMIYNNYIEQQKVKDLQEQKNLLHNLFSEAPLGMFSYDINLKILDANKHLHKMFERPKSLVGVNLESLPNKHVVNVFKYALTQGPQSYVGSCHTPKGNHFWIETKGFAFKSADNNILGGMGIIEDKTKEYEDKKELESMHIKLQDQIEDNQRLLNENKQFIADMVHQIKTPLSVIITNSSLIEMKSDLQFSSYITQINSAINMLSNAYDDLSYIISNDTLEYKPMDINFTNFLSERVDFFEVNAQANHKTIDTNIANGITLYMNDTELERLIDNNISNAIKHSDDESEIKIFLTEDHSEIVLKFVSYGKNIKDVSKVFDKNYTESYSAKRSLGLGLNMVKNICDKYGIIYTVHSKDHINTFTYIFKATEV